ncbi:MAG: hypothetical protein GKS03_09785 [Alphaproteobacteria bacterium]|nr:hypothetical protein [Alphaproteobacteria bacterium]
MTDEITTPRPAQGKRPQYFDDPNMDQMHAMIIALATEVSVLTDRFDTIERVLEEKGTVDRADIENWQPDEKTWDERREQREQLIRRLFRTVREARTTLEGRDGQSDDE